jgi:hypothetical protein
MVLHPLEEELTIAHPETVVVSLHHGGSLG